MEYGLIGYPLGHSWSKEIHDALGFYEYYLNPLPSEEAVHAYLEAREFKAINVTIPYKKTVIPHCAEITPQAAAIGVVNTVVNRGGLLYGYNTDYLGFDYLCKKHGVSFAGKTVMILGTGATYNTVYTVCRDQGAAEILTVSRRAKPGVLSYEEAARRADTQIVINASPCGMFPHAGECLLDIEGLHKLEAVVDVVYNPYETELMRRARAKGIPAHCGLEMLVAQAVIAAEFFLDRKIDRSEIDRITEKLRREKNLG